MHILLLIVVGLLVLAALVLVAYVLGRFGHAIDGARPFIWLWLIVSLANSAMGVLEAGVPIINEIGAFVPIFGVPAVMAWYLSRRHRARIKS